MERTGGRDLGPIAVGLVLIAIGVIFLAGQALNFDLGHYGWPLFIIAPGVAILIVALLLPGPAGAGLAVVGSMVTVTGLILLFQDATDYYDSWDYAWALVAPGSVGFGLLLAGLAHGDRSLIESGSRVSAVGLALFLIFGIFFEGVIVRDPNAPPALRDVILPGGLLLLGAAIVASSLLGRRHQPQ